MNLNFNLQLVRYRLCFRVTEPIKLANYAGSALRGAFGHALMQLSGLTEEDTKQKSLLFQHSPYAEVFEPSRSTAPLASESEGVFASLHDSPVPYVIEAPVGGERYYKKGDIFSFDLVLIKAALKHLPFIILAWRRALLRGIDPAAGGLNKGLPGKAELSEVFALYDRLDYSSGEQAQHQLLIYTEEKPIVKPHEQQLEWPDFSQLSGAELKLNFVTPLRLQHKGKILNSQEITPALFLRGLMRRVLIYLQLETPDQPFEAQTEILKALCDQVQGEPNFKVQHWARYSSRQNQKMVLSGSIGTWRLSNIPVELLPFIWLGQYLHVGKNTSFGLGRYRIIEWR